MELRNQTAARFCCALFPFIEWLPLLNKSTLKQDIISGIVAGVLILPQAIALATIAGMPPEYGLYTSIFPVIFAALFGSSWHALSGPNTALVVMIATAVAPYASIGTPDYITYVLTLTFMVGAIQLVFALARLGVIFNYFSQTVMSAIITGVGIVIIVQQLGNFMGLIINVPEDIEDTIYQLFHSAYLANYYALSAGAITIISGLLSKKYFPKLPYLIVAVVIGMLASKLIDLIFGYGVTNIDKLGNLSLLALPLSAPDFSPENFAEAAEGLIPAAFVIALMGLIQSTVIARSMAVRSGQNVNMNQEVAGQGVANILGSFLSCFPSCGSFNRSASNIESGAMTPLAGIVSAIALATIVIFAAPVISGLPIPVMAGVLILVGFGLIKLKDIKKLLMVRGESRIVFILVLGTTLYGGLQDGVFLGAFLSIVIYLKSVSKPEINLLSGDSASAYHPDDRHESTVLHVSGSLFFGSVQAVENALSDIASYDRRKGTLIIAGEYIQDMDKSGIDTLVQEAKRRKDCGGILQLWFRNQKFDQQLQESGLIKLIGSTNIFYRSDSQ